MPFKKDLYNAITIQFDSRHYMTVGVVKSCLDHIPPSAWVEGRDKGTRWDDPQEQKFIEKLWRKYKV